MSGIRGKDTAPEMWVRRMLTRHGYRYRIHVPSLTGKPDIVFARRRIVIVVNGCFWHSHRCGVRPPKSRAEYWGPKLAANVSRDRRNARLLRAAGYRVLTVWECAIAKRPRAVEERLLKALGPTKGADA